jgi:hypothetical protein
MGRCRRTLKLPVPHRHTMTQDSFKGRIRDLDHREWDGEEGLGLRRAARRILLNDLEGVFFKKRNVMKTDLMDFIIRSFDFIINSIQLYKMKNENEWPINFSTTHHDASTVNPNHTPFSSFYHHSNFNQRLQSQFYCGQAQPQ